MDKRALNLKRALVADEFYEYLVGKKGYAYVCPYADMPTYPSEVFGSIVSYFNASKDLSIWQNFEKTVVAMSTDASYAWLSLYYLVEYLRYSQRVQPRNLTNLCVNITNNLGALKKELLHENAWVGSDYPDHLWGDVQRMIRNINEEMGLQLAV